MTGTTGLVRINRDITADRTLRRGTVYLVSRQVHVHAGVTLTVEDGVRIGLLNGRIAGAGLRRAALVFDAGSRLQARRLTVMASDRHGVAQARPDNGGLWFLGGHLEAAKDGMRVRKTRATPLSSFHATRLSARYLGRGDARPGSVAARRDDAQGLDDLDALSVMGVGPSEWNIREIHSLGSGDDGLDLHRSAIVLRRLRVDNPTEDGVNISSGRLDIVDELRVTMARRGERPGQDADRDLFDLEVDTSPSCIVLHRGARVRLRGVFGDEVRLQSSDLPQHQQGGRAIYRFDGRCERDLALVYSIHED